MALCCSVSSKTLSSCFFRILYHGLQLLNMSPTTGYNKLGNEITAHATDWREQIDLSTPHPLPLPTAPRYHNLLSPNQWPSPEYLPSFRPVYESYISQMSTLSTFFTSLIAEALGLPPTALDRFFDDDQQHKLKIIKYPDLDDLDAVSHQLTKAKSIDADSKGQIAQRPRPAEQPSQGVGPHKDSMLTSYLLQATPHKGLQAQNLSGEWIDCPPVPDTLVVAIGQGLEALTGGVCISTTHRVLSPSRGQGPRFSVPFFQGVSYDATFESVESEIPIEVKEMRREIVNREGGQREKKDDDVEFTFEKGRWEHLGEATLWNRCKSHMDVAERWYPDIWRRILESQGKVKVGVASDVETVGTKPNEGISIEAH